MTKKLTLLGMNTFRKADYFLTIGLVTFAVVYGSITGLQLLPFIIFAILGYIQIYRRKNVKLWLIILSALMLMTNIYIFSLIDIMVWFLALVVFAI